MLLVLDNNILFSLMNPGSVNSYLFSSLKTGYFAPEFAKFELNKYRRDCLLKSGLSEHEFEIRQVEIKSNIKFLKSSEYTEFIEMAANNLSDSKDSPYLALALSIKSSIWSNDPHFKEQSLVKVYSTKELVEKLLKEDL